MNFDRSRLERMLNPQSIAVVGDKGPQYRWLTSQSEFTGKIYSVQLDENEIKNIEAKGYQNFKSLLDVPGDVDLLICAVPRQITPFVVADAVKKGVAGISMYTSGFAETGEPPAIELQRKLVAMCTDAQMPLIGPNCLGVYNRRLGVKFSDGQLKGEGGDVGIISQSGTHGTGMTIGAQRLGVKVTRAVSIGNAALLNECDYLEYMRDDSRSPAILMYLEGIKEGRRFFDLLRETTRRKPVIIWRGGRSRAGARAVRSHTASLASDDKVWDALMRQCNAISAGTIDEALDALAALVYTRKPSGRGIALIATTGGQSVAITDQFERAGFEIPELSARSYERLSEFFVTIGGSYRNPFDAASTIGQETDNLRKILEIIADDSAIDAGVAIELGGGRGTDRDSERLDAQLDLLNAYRDKTGLPVVVAMPSGGVMSDGEGSLSKAREAAQAKGFAVFPSFQRAGAALSRIVDYHARQASR